MDATYKESSPKCSPKCWGGTPMVYEVQSLGESFRKLFYKRNWTLYYTWAKMYFISVIVKLYLIDF